ncbi:hypothetical protein D3C78_1119620 [compost metagenome]
MISSTFGPKRFLKKSPMVSRFMRYSGRANTRPTSIRQPKEPNGSSMIPAKPSSMKVAGIPSTASEPNQVANTIAATRGKDMLRPPAAKSLELCTRVEA